MIKDKVKQEKQTNFMPVVGSNTLVCNITGEVKYLSVLVDDANQNYDEYIVQ